MSQHYFNVGDEVQHKAGTIKMIYIGESSLGDALCEWTDANGMPRRESFAHVALKKFEEPSFAGMRVI